jgi:hypothetical protein
MISPTTGIPIPASSRSIRLTDGYEAWERAQWRRAFERTEIRHSSKRRVLDCNHTIGVREPYRYYVAKLTGMPGVIQRRDCDVCMRRDNRY